MMMALDPAYFTLLGVYNGPWPNLPGYSSLSPLVNGTAGNDNIVLTGGLLNLNVTVNGLGGNDRIDSSSVGLVNSLFGGAGEDQIYGGAGVNTIVGGDGDDYIDGGGGIDILDARNAGGGDNGNDTVSYESLSAGLGVILTLNASGGGAARSGLNGDTLLGGFENVVGSAYNDTITGNALSNILIGLNGNDTLNGGDGNDTLVGGHGFDTLTGGAGSDRYAFMDSLDSIEEQPEEILDFARGVDKIDLSAYDKDTVTPGRQAVTLGDIDQQQNTQDFVDITILGSGLYFVVEATGILQPSEFIL
jgi:Ca2+-binding RTX toxin-like protein